jgi:hypothetical protein
MSRSFLKDVTAVGSIILGFFLFIGFVLPLAEKLMHVWQGYLDKVFGA